MLKPIRFTTLSYQNSIIKINLKKVNIIGVGKFIDMCKLEGLDYKRIILDSIKE